MRPLPRRDRRHETTTNSTASAAHGGSLVKQLFWFVINWVKVSWKDLIAMAILGAASLSIYQAPVAAVRNFPITFDTSGDIVYPEMAYPNRQWIISPVLSAIISAVIPVCIILLAQIRIRSFWDANNAILGLLYSLILSALFQVIMKQLIGGFRPYFLSVCQPDISRAQSHNATGLNAVGFRQIMYTVDVCTNPDKVELQTAMTSFPSGHATAAFAGYVFLFLWMNAKLKVWANFQASFYWLALLLAPLLAAALMAAALTIDQAHNWYDILAGIAIGTIVAFMSYRVCYAAVWDWRYNHIPLTRDNAFDYDMAASLMPEYMERAVWTRKLGWGRRRKAVRRSMREKRRGGSEASSATYARNGSTSAPYAQGLSYPDSAAVRVNGQHHARGDEMV
ncbi:Lipid phosphate phosphatase 1 [Madurella mycetomatis]|uniref:Lipid phosphate phosphatase 1 n=1 Tax=Madurella mycetomatis TaxID=100816 RepID=A0A175W3P2_9PEZI|nr:Lipid phosphate phosphatase 1 [Madurella mycetomatis]